MTHRTPTASGWSRRYRNRPGTRQDQYATAGHRPSVAVTTRTARPDRSAHAPARARRAGQRPPSVPSRHPSIGARP